VLHELPSREFPNVELEHLLVDNAMRLIAASLGADRPGLFEPVHEAVPLPCQASRARSSSVSPLSSWTSCASAGW
jgi:hypothetical protein